MSTSMTTSSTGACASGSTGSGAALLPPPPCAPFFQKTYRGLPSACRIHVSHSKPPRRASRAVSSQHTFFPLNVSITFSAPARSTNIISAITVGCEATSLQFVMSPPTLCITLSMSAAVVPGAKFCATTV